MDHNQCCLTLIKFQLIHLFSYNSFNYQTKIISKFLFPFSIWHLSKKKVQGFLLLIWALYYMWADPNGLKQTFRVIFLWNNFIITRNFKARVTSKEKCVWFATPNNAIVCTYNNILVIQPLQIYLFWSDSADASFKSIFQLLQLSYVQTT